MKYCPNCGTAIEDNNKFCSNCGQPLMDARSNADSTQAHQQYQQPPVQPKKRHTLRNILMVIGIIAVIGWVYNFFTTPAIDPATEYKNGCNYYNSKDYEKAKECFSQLDEEYKDTELYLILCNGHIHHFLNDEQIRTLKKNLDFNDTKSLLLSESPIAEQFLLGYWASENKSKSLEFYDAEDGRHVQTNLAQTSSWEKADSFYIIDGVFGLYMPKKDDKSKDDSEDSDLQEYSDEFDRKDLFRISILDKDRIAVVVLKDDHRYILERD